MWTIKEVQRDKSAVIRVPTLRLDDIVVNMTSNVFLLKNRHSRV
jgi:hypothetical protein